MAAPHVPDEQRDGAAPRLAIARPTPAVLTLQLSGTWRFTESVPAAPLVQAAIDVERPATMGFETSALAAWDSALVSFAARVVAIGDAVAVPVDRSGLPPGVQRLLALAETPPRRPKEAPPPRPSLLARIGMHTVERGQRVTNVLAWIGDLTVAFGRLLMRRAKFRFSDLTLQLELTGARALGIVSLVAALLGLILAFVGAVQLQRFGASLYVADLVGIAMVREMGAMMAAIVVAGRTGAAYAAELGTMRVTQEIDALATLGIPPVEFLVLPRVIAVTLMLPLLCLFADLVGVLGGAFVGVAVMEIPLRIYVDQTIAALSLGDVLGGMVKAMAYGFLIGVAACFEGLRSGRTAAAVGKAATSAVVDGIVLVIAACGCFAVVFYLLGV